MPCRDAVFEQTVVYLCKLQILLVVASKKITQEKTFTSKQYRAQTQIIQILFCFVLIWYSEVSWALLYRREGKSYLYI